MMTFYSKPYRKASRAAFASAAVFVEFRSRDARALNYNGFIDRRPDQKPPLPPMAWRVETNSPQWANLADEEPES